MVCPVSEIDNQVMKLKGAYKEESVLSPQLVEPLRYYINKDLETELCVEVHAHSHTHKCMHTATQT